MGAPKIMFSRVKTRERHDFGLQILDFRSRNNLIVEHHAAGTKIIGCLHSL
jgi:hypothetical protein